ncbi:MAG: hypothetical protein PQJ46_05815, partial [Spirochaetales bacterium]|nr:hypothetical protein [Spirochaetales bacterium]
GDNDNQMISASIVTDILYLKLGKFSLFSEISLGPIWVLDPDGTRVQLLISFSVIPCYMFEFAVD